MQLNIVFVTGGLTFNGNTDREKALGGSETALISVAREMAKMGHYVRVFCSCDKEGLYDNVFYWDITKFKDFIRNSECDILIVSRFYEFLANNKINSKLNILWNHDILVDEKPLLSSIWNYDYMYCLSEFHKEQFIEKVPEIGSIVKLIPNGVDRSLVKHVKNKEHRIMFTSRPERGLYPALKIFEAYGDKDLELLICNYETVEDPAVKEVEKYCDLYITDLIAKGFKITVDRFVKEQLYYEIAKSKSVLYPTSFPEIFCISAIEAQANGTAYITTDDFALPEVVLYDRCSMTDDLQKYTEMLMKVIRDDKYREELQTKGIENTLKYSWAKVAEQFIDDALIHFEKRADNHKGIIERLVYESDYVMAKEAMGSLRLIGETNEETMEWLEPLQKQIVNGINKVKNSAKEIYEDETTFEPTCFDALASVPRMQWAAHAVKDLGIKSILSYGCHNGVSEILISNQNPECGVVGYDISPKIIKEANKLKNEHAKYKDKVYFTSEKDMSGIFDAVYAGEILEHVEDPLALIEELEAYVKPGGKMLITLPRGAWEHLSHLENMAKGRVCHIHGFDWWDIQNIFGLKKDFDLLEYWDGGSHGYYNEPIGNYLITYTVDHDIKCGKRDLERKLLTYRPYQGISACIIARDATNSIERLLDSIVFEMDEIIIGIDHDEGECDEFIRRIEKFKKVKWFYISKRIVADGYGFANARNEVIDKANHNWIFWIDTDEQLVKSEYFRKYLDTSYVNSYNIRQEHPQLDSFLEADKPQRLFRKGKGRFVGFIHEQVQDLEDINKGVDPSFILANTHVLNFGELYEAMRRDKGMGRNLELLEKDVKENVDKRMKAGKTIRYMSIILMMRDFINRIIYSIERFKTADNRDSKELSLPQIKNLYNKFFRDIPDDQDVYHKNIAYKYLQDAMKLCNDGTEVKIEIGDLVYCRMVEDEGKKQLEELLKVI